MNTIHWIEIGDKPPDWNSRNPFYLVCNKPCDRYAIAFFSRVSKTWLVDDAGNSYLPWAPTHYAILTPP